MTGSLYLTATNPVAKPIETPRLEDLLRRIAFIGEPLAMHRYIAGERLLRYITFAGCSPHLVFERPSNGSDDFCHVAIMGPYSNSRMITGPHTVNPRCPSCRARLSEWRTLRSSWDADPGKAIWRCPSCSMKHPIADWRWRQTAVFGRQFIAVRGVFTAEGVPSDDFIRLLTQETGRPWCFGWGATEV